MSIEADVKASPVAAEEHEAVDEFAGLTRLNSLSPSRASDFMSCPLLYRFRVIDKLPEQPSIDAVRGSVVHKVLEDLFDLPALDRTHERANILLPGVWDDIAAASPEVAQMFDEASSVPPPRTSSPGSTSAGSC